MPKIHLPLIWKLNTFASTVRWILLNVTFFSNATCSKRVIQHGGKIGFGCSDYKCQSRFISALPWRENGPKCWKKLWLKFSVCSQNMKIPTISEKWGDQGFALASIFAIPELFEHGWDMLNQAVNVSEVHPINLKELHVVPDRILVYP